MSTARKREIIMTPEKIQEARLKRISGETCESIGRFYGVSGSRIQFLTRDLSPKWGTLAKRRAKEGK